MRTASSVLVAAALLASASSSLAAPELGAKVGAGISAHAGNGRADARIGAGGAVDLGLVKVEAGISVGGEIELCRDHAGLELDVKVKGSCKFFSENFSERMRTKAHLTFESALELYHDVMYLMRHTLMTRGAERMVRLIEISALIRDAENILINAEIYNAVDTHFVRRKWIAHEIKSLRTRLEFARKVSLHLPNLCLAEDMYHFVIDASIKVVKGVLAVPVIAGAAVYAGFEFSAHLAARAFHFMGSVLKWAIEEVEHAFLVFRLKVKAGIKAIGRGLAKFGHATAEAAGDIGAIIVDIAHHKFGKKHHCPRRCSTAVVVVAGSDSSSSSSSSDDDCSSCDDTAAAVVSLTEVCTVEKQVCTQKKFGARLHAQYDIELNWDETTAVTEVTQTVTKINAALGGLQGELRTIEIEAGRADLESEAEDASSEE